MLFDQRDERYLRALSLLHRLALERTGWRRWLLGRWETPSEPLRIAAGRLVREADFHQMRPRRTRLVGGTDDQ